MSFSITAVRKAHQTGNHCIAKDSLTVTDYLSLMTVAQQLKTAYEVTMGLLKFDYTP